MDNFLSSSSLIWEDGTVEKLNSDNCLSIEKDVSES
jgi:hypothetical protein